jgi:glutamate---cysteine ligase / carboxylate-amine ligase
MRQANFGCAADFSLGIEEELVLVDPDTHELEHSAVDVLTRMSSRVAVGSAHPEAYAALVELSSPICSDVVHAVRAVAALREQLWLTGAAAIGSGLHPSGLFGDVVHYPAERYRLIASRMRGLMERTPTSALHVHVGMPDPDAAIRACNGMRAYLPLLQALSANSPFWYGHDSGLASARAMVFRAFPSSQIPPAFASYDAYAAEIDRLTVAGGMPDYTYLWWDIRPHPVLGTIEVRAMDAQSSLGNVAGLAALIHSLSLWAAEEPGPWEREDVLTESSFRAARDGMHALLWHDGRMTPVSEVAATAVALARPYARDLGCEGALEEVERIVSDGNGAIRQRASFVRGGMSQVLEDLVAETSSVEDVLVREPLVPRVAGLH